MSTLAVLQSSALARWVQPLSDTLLQLLWQLGLLGLLAAALLHALRRASPQARYAVCAAALLMSLLLAALQLGSRWSEAEGVALPSPLLAQPAAAPQAPAPMAGTALDTDDTGPDLWPVLAPWRQALVAGWLAGVLLMATRLAAGLLCVARWRRQSVLAPAAWQARLDDFARGMALPRPVALRLLPAGVAASVGPFTVGWWRPVVLMPAALLTGLPAPLLEALLAHELAHVRRWDYLANLLQRVVEALLFFHPVVWWLSRRLRAERELVADALAAQQLPSARPLALALQALAEMPSEPASRPEPSLAIAAAGGDLLQRVRALMQRPAPARSPSSQLLSALLLLGLLALTLLLVPPGGVNAAVSAVQRVAEPAPVADAPDGATATWTATAAGFASASHPGRPALPALPALPTDLPLASPHVLVTDADTGAVLLSRHAQDAVPIASVSKLMTALVVLDAGQDLQQPLEVNREDVRGAAHSVANLQAGQRLTRADALVLMLQASDNRAALLLARHLPGGRAGFEQAAQAQARRLGLQSATLRHPTGAPDSNRASAQDVARLLQAAAAQPLIRQAAGSAQLTVQVDGQPREASHSVPLVGAPGWSILLAKSGFNRAAGRCVALQLQADGRRLNVVLLGAPDARQREADLARIRDALRV